MPILPEPFDVAVTRTVGGDCTVVFDGRTYSVPFRLLGQRVEVRGCSDRGRKVRHDVLIVREDGVWEVGSGREDEELPDPE